MTSDQDLDLWAFRPGARAWHPSAAGTSAWSFHRSLPGYQPTPLVEAPGLAADLQVGAVWVKDESNRMGLPAFKVLGASWAVNCALRACDGAGPADSLGELQRGLGSGRPTLVTATDGNHGRAVAWMAHLLDLPARIYVPAVISAVAIAAIAAEGAEVVQTDLVYDDVVALAASSCVDRADQVLVQDTSWADYTEIPQRIVDGYATLFTEVDEQLSGVDADLVVVPTGVGSLLQAALEHYRATGLRHRPSVLAVEPVTAACVTRSLAAGAPVSVDTSAFTILAGLNCGTVSDNAWPAIRAGLDAGIGITDAAAVMAVDRLSRYSVAAGPCGAAALAGAAAALSSPRRRTQLGLGPDSVVILVSTEGTAANVPVEAL